MRARLFEVRHGEQVYSAMAIELFDDVSESRVWLLARAGYPRDEPKKVMLTLLDTMESHESVTAWPALWQKNLHKFVIENLDTIYDGKVVDVDFLLAEREKPRVSSRAV